MADLTNKSSNRKKIKLRVCISVTSKYEGQMLAHQCTESLWVGAVLPGALGSSAVGSPSLLAKARSVKELRGNQVSGAQKTVLQPLAGVT